jgi:murein DD-endopeptidase MepM/ murein hydrolase activator NlpD
MANALETVKQNRTLTPKRDSILMRYLRHELNRTESWIPVTNEFNIATPAAGLPSATDYVIQGIQHTADGALDALYTGPALKWQVQQLQTPVVPPLPALDTTRALVGLDANRPINPTSGAISATINPDLAQNVQIVRINFIVGPYGSPSNPDWKARYDAVVDGYIKRGIQVYGLIGHEITNYPDTLLTEEGDSATGRTWIAEYVSRFVTVVTHFRGRVTFWESYNEPSAWHPIVKKPVVHPYWFARLLQDVYQAVKIDRGMKDVTLISGPLFAHTIAGENAESAQVNYLNNTFKAGRRHHGWDQFQKQHGTMPFDGLGYHLYVYERENVPPATIKAALESYLNQIYNAWKSNDGNALKKKIYISEFGWQSNDMGEDQQKERMTTAFRVFLNDSRVGAAIWFCTQGFKANPHDNEPPEEWGIYASNNLSQLKLAGQELRRIAAIARSTSGTAPLPLNRLANGMASHTTNGTNGNAHMTHHALHDSHESVGEDDELATIPVAQRLDYVMAQRQPQSAGSAISRLAASDLVTVPIADTFQFPLGRPNQPLLADFKRDTDFLDPKYYANEKIWHPGEDWNLTTGGDSDLREPVYAAANGKVITSGHFPTWGNIILIEHQLPNGERVWTQYAHLNERLVFAGDIVERGNGIGTIGKGAHGIFSAHLHFEIRKENLSAEHWWVKDAEYIRDRYHNPSAFIKLWQKLPSRWAHDVVVDSQANNRHTGTFSTSGTPQAWFSAPRGYLGRTLWAYTIRDQETAEAEWRPALRDGGEYEVFAYVPGENATTTNAQYIVAHAEGETVVSVNQEVLFDDWASLGKFRFSVGNSGSVRLSNETGEANTRQIAFDAMRWVRLL